MVYFVQSPFTRNFQNSWICGGALVSPTQILTAAACLIEAENIYAIAGYKKYLKAENIESDECTRTKKQRVVKILIPTGYKLDYANPAQRLNIDIGVAVVEKPYNFSDLSYLIHCTYEPQPVRVNYDKDNELINTRAVALGWGVIEKTPAITNKTKHQHLQEASTMIVDKKTCTNVTDTEEFLQMISKYHLCGTINLEEVIEDNAHETQSFNSYKMRRHQPGFERKNGSFKDYFEYRRSYNEGDYSEPRGNVRLNLNNNNNNNTRKALHQNFCQNNLGSPLIKWVHDREVVIGITPSTNINGECNGPLLYVSTAASSKIIKCLLETNIFTRKLCNRKITGELYEIQEIEIKWPNYQQSKILEPMLLIQRAVLNKLQPLIPRPTIIINSTKKYDTQQNPNKSNENIAQHENVFIRSRVHEEYAHLRAQLPPLLSRPQYDIGIRHQSEQKYNPILSSEEISSTQYYPEPPRHQFSPLQSRPQHNINDRYKKEQQQDSLSEEFPLPYHDKELLRPQFNFQSDQQNQLLSTRSKSKPDYQQEHTRPENLKYQSPSYHQYESQTQQQRGSRYEQNNERIEHYSLMREQYQPHLVQIYGSPSEKQYKPLIVTKQQQEPLIPVQHELATSQEHVSAIELQQQYVARPVNGLLQSKQFDAVLGQRLPYRQNKPLDTKEVYLPPTLDQSLQHKSIENKSIKQEFQQPELLYDFSPELQFGDLKLGQEPESVKSQDLLQKGPAEIPNSQPNLYQQAYMGGIELPYQKQLEQSNTTTLSDDSSFSFDELFAQLRDLPSESPIQVNTATPEKTLKQIYGRILRDNNQHHDMPKSTTEISVTPDEVIIRPQIPMISQYD